jgi:AcrR family transcriptional regulator
VDSEVKRPSGRHHGDLRRVLEQAALELVAEGGPKACTLAEVSRRAGVSVAAPYKHFADRDALLATLVQKGYAEQRERYVEAMKGESDPAGQLAAFARAYVQFAAERRAMFELTFSAGLDKTAYPELLAAGDELFAVLQEPADKLRATEAASRELVLSVAAAAHGFAVFVLEGVLVNASEAEKLAESAARSIVSQALSTRG